VNGEAGQTGLIVHTCRTTRIDKGRPELGSGVLERVTRELNRRTDVGMRWSVEGLRRLARPPTVRSAHLMIKVQHKYHQGPWSPQ
jgi:hypothetical protein